MVKRSFLSGALILMAAGFIVRIFGFFYRVYLSNLISAEGMGLFQLIAPVYNLVILTLTSGISVAVSKMVAEEAAKRHFVNLRRITACAMILVLISGILVSVLMILRLDFITDYILKDRRTYYSLLLLIPCIPVVAAASALKGYFYGTQDVVPTAVSQIVEQFVKIGLVMLTAGHFIKMGLEFACALATVAMAVGEISNLGVLYAVYAVRRHKDKRYKTRTGILRKRKIIKDLFSISTPISFNRFITSAMGALEVILIPRRLAAGGLGYQESIESYGKLTGMVMPLLFFPSLVTYSIATTLVPAISEAISVKNFKSVNYRISKSIQLTFLLGFISTAVFLTYPHEIGNIFYRRENIGDILYLFSFTCAFIYLHQILVAILNGLGKQGKSLRNSVIGNIIRIGFVYFLMPAYGINGYAWGIIVSYLCVNILNIYDVSKTTGMAIDIRNWVLRPALIGVLMVFTGKYIHGFFKIFISSNMWVTIISLITNLAIAFLLVVAAGVFEKKEITRLFSVKKL